MCLERQAAGFGIEMREGGKLKREANIGDVRCRTKFIPNIVELKQAICAFGSR